MMKECGKALQEVDYMENRKNFERKKLKRMIGFGIKLSGKHEEF